MLLSSPSSNASAPPTPSALVIPDASSPPPPSPGYSQPNSTTVTVSTGAALRAALKTANKKVCTTPCTTIIVTEDVTMEDGDDPFPVESSVYLYGDCDGGMCTVDGANVAQIFAVSGGNTSAVVQNFELTRGKATIGDSTFGGAAVVSDAAHVDFRNCDLTLNKAGRGGAIAVYGGASMTCSWCTFSSNSATESGGAVSVGGSYGYIRYSTFTNNQADVGGGAYLLDGYDELWLQNCTFDGNAAETGSDGYLPKYTTSTLECGTECGSVYPSNATTSWNVPPAPPAPPPPPSPPGPPSPPPPVVSPSPPPPSPPAPPPPPGATVSVATEKELAKAIRDMASTVVLTGNVALTGDYASARSSSYDGKTLLPVVLGQTTIVGSCGGNAATGVVDAVGVNGSRSAASACLLDAKALGRVFEVAGSWASLTLRNLLLTRGSVGTSSGGAILSTGSATVVLDGVGVFNSSAASGAGALVLADGFLRADDSTFAGNEAYNLGGGVAGSGTLVFDATSFATNSAGQGGGVALVNASASLSVLDGAFSGNSATLRGGDIYLDGSDDQTLSSSPYADLELWDVYPALNDSFASTLSSVPATPSPSTVPAGVGYKAPPPPGPPAPPPPPPLKAGAVVYTELELAAALLSDTPIRHIELRAHIVVRGTNASTYALLPSVRWGTEIYGNCAEYASFTGDPDSTKCMLDAKGAGRIFGIVASGKKTVTLRNLSIMNGASDSGDGGAVLVSAAAPVVIDSCDIGGSQVAEGSNGGALSVAAATSVSLTSVNVGNSSASGGRGGGVYLAVAATMTSCTFHNNTASYGGGLYLASAATPTLSSDATWSENSADEDDGGDDVYVTDGVRFCLSPVVSDGQPDVKPSGSAASCASPPPSPTAPPPPKSPPSPPPPSPPPPPAPTACVLGGNSGGAGGA